MANMSMTKEEHTKSENISLGINFALRGIELIFNIVVNVSNKLLTQGILTSYWVTILLLSPHGRDREAKQRNAF